MVRRILFPEGFAWSKSSINDYLACGRRFFLKHVEKRKLDQVSSGFAGPRGTGAHAGIALVLERANAGQRPSDEEIHGAIVGAFAADLKRNSERGEAYDDDAAVVAIEALETELTPIVARLADDPRIRAVRWDMIEQRFDWTDAHGRRYRGTIDAGGIVQEDFRGFGRAGRDEVNVEAGERIVADWKAGEIGTGHVERSVNAELGFYGVSFQRRGEELPDRMFFGRLEDLEIPKRPRDENGDPIPSKDRKENPAWRALVDEGLSEAAASRRAKKWIETPNQAFVEATSKPKGPVFHACDINYEIALQTISHAIAAAEAGFYPASGANNGACMRCPFRMTCTDTNPPKEGN